MHREVCVTLLLLVYILLQKEAYSRWVRKPLELLVNPQYVPQNCDWTALCLASTRRSSRNIFFIWNTRSVKKQMKTKILTLKEIFVTIKILLSIFLYKEHE